MPGLRPSGGDVVSGVPAVVEVVLSRWVLGGAVAVILLVVGVLAWGSARGAALADGRDDPLEAARVADLGDPYPARARVYHPGLGLGTVAEAPRFADHVFVDFDDAATSGGRLVRTIDLCPVDAEQERRFGELLDRGAVLYFGPRPSPRPAPPVVPPPGSPLAEAEALLAAYTPCSADGVRCQWHDAEFCTGDVHCCPSCPNQS